MSLLDAFKGTSWTPVVPPTPIVQLGPTNLFETSITGTGPNGLSWNANPKLYATEATAEALMHIFGAAAIVMVNTTPTGPYVLPPQRFLFFPVNSKLRNPDGSYFYTSTAFQSNAGDIARFFEQEPESQFPDVIFDTLARHYGWLTLLSDYGVTLTNEGTAGK